MVHELPRPLGRISGVSPARKRGYVMAALNVAGVTASVVAHRVVGRRIPKLAVPASMAVNAIGIVVHDQFERRRPYREGWKPQPPDTRRDAAFLLAAAPTTLATSFIAAKVGERVRIRLGVHRLPVIPGILIGELAFGLWHYWAHRISHEQGWAWRVHSVHHSPTRFYTRLGVQVHALELGPDSFADFLIPILLGLSPQQLAGVKAIHLWFGTGQHSNADVDHGPLLNLILSTPEQHRWHHSQDYAEGDTNYCGNFALWDHVFGTYFMPDRPYDSEIGVGRMPSFPRDLVGMQLAPFRWKEIVEDNADTWYVPAGTPTAFHTPSTSPKS